MGLREHKKQATRRAILDAAERNFRDNGLEGTRLQDLFEQVGISERTFFNYFPSKQALVSALTVEWYRARGVEMRERLEQVRSAETVLPEFIDGCCRAAREIESDRDYMALLLVHTPLFSSREHSGRADDEQSAFVDARDSHYEYLVAVFDLARERGEIRHGLSSQDVLDLYTAVIGTVVPRWLKGYYEPAGKLENRVRKDLGALFYGIAT